MDFKTFYLLANKDEYKGNLNAFAITCQTYLETGNYSSELAIKANNYAGIKTTTNWKGETYSVDSPEYIDGVKYIKRSSFRKYNNADKFILDYIEKLKLSRYDNVRKYGFSNFICYFYSLYIGGWATDIIYPKKLINVAMKLGPMLIDADWNTKIINTWNDAQSKPINFSNDFIEFMNSKLNIESSTKESIKSNDNQSKTIVIDPGHGGKDPGARNSTLNVNEDDIVLSVGLKVNSILKTMGYNSILTRTDSNTYMSPNDKGEFANKHNADLMISIHCNSTTDTSVQGHEDFYFAIKDNNGKTKSSTEGKKLATELNDSYMELFPNAKNRKVKGANYAVLRIPKCVSALTEFDFISNDEQCKFMTNDDNQLKFANAICNAIKNYLG